MGQINAVILQGYLGKDPEVGETTKGKPKIMFDLATSQYFNTPPTWSKIIAYDRHATIIHNLGLGKGDLVTIRGFLANGPPPKKDTLCTLRHMHVVAVECYLLKRKKDSGRIKATSEGEAPI